MKKLFLSMAVCVSLCATAQNTVTTVRHLAGYNANLQENAKNTGSYETDSTIVKYVMVGSNNSASNTKKVNEDYYLKMTKDTAFISISLKEGVFQVGDSVVILAYHDTKSITTGVKFKSENKVLASITAGEPAYGSYKLVAADIKEDGSLTFYRADAQLFLHSIDIYRTTTTTVPTFIISSSEEQGNNRIYTLFGTYVGTNLDILPAGTYILNGKKIIK